MNEHDLDKLLKIEEDDNLINKKIKHNLNKKIYSKIIKSFLVVVVLVTSIYYGSSFVFNEIHYSPYNEEKFVDNSKSYEFIVLLQNYIQMHYPGMLVSLESPDDTLYESLGSGKYIINVKIQRIFDYRIVDGKTNTTFTIDKSKMSLEISDDKCRLSQIFNEFKDKENSNFTAVYKIDDIINAVKELPDSSYIDTSISFENDKSMEQLTQLIKKYPNANFVWAALRLDNVEDHYYSGISYGMSLYDASKYDFTKKAQEKYPGYYLPYKDQLTADDLKQSYLSKLKLLIDHPEFISVTNSAFNDGLSSLKQLKHNYNSAKKSMSTYGVRVYMKKKDLLAMIENEDVSYVMIHDIKLSQYQR